MKDFIKNIKFVWIYNKRNKYKLIIEAILDLIAIGIGVVIPILSANQIISLTDNELTRLIYISLVLLVVQIIERVIYYICGRIMIRMYRDNLIEIQSDLGKVIMRLETPVLDSNSSGLFIQRLTSDTEKLADIFGIIDDYLFTIVSNIGVFGAIFIVNKLVFVYLFLANIGLTVLEHYQTKKDNKLDEISRKEREKLTGFINELVHGVRDIKMLNSEKSFTKSMREKAFNYNEKARNRSNTRNANWMLSVSLNNMSNFFLIIIMVLLIKRDTLTITAAIILFNYASRVNQFTYSFGYFLEALKDFNLSSKRVSEILDDEKFAKEKFGDVHLDKIEGNFEFKDVTFRYEKGGRKILDKINFKVNANETVAFVGKTGAGKSTIFSLLCKMYEPSSGKITIDGVDINKLDKDSIRGNITIISQNPYIFNVSIKDNLKLVKEDVSDKEIKEACKLACLDKFISKLPNGYDTIIGEGGVNLSGGEKQRLAIARALIQKTEIILFDEATSALDNETQAHIQKAIENMKNEYTIMIIAHRLSTIINADRIMFISDGKVVAEGSHKKLLRTCKEYKELYESEIEKGK